MVYRAAVKTGVIFTNATNKKRAKEFVTFLLQDEDTDVICLTIEAVRDGPAFVRLLDDAFPERGKAHHPPGALNKRNANQRLQLTNAR